MPELTDVSSDQQSQGLAVNLTIDRDAAGRFGISPTDIDTAIYDLIGQAEVTQYYTQQNSYHVVLEAPPELQATPDLFNSVYLLSPITGANVPLSLFVKVDPTATSSLTVSHQDEYPAATLSFNLAPGVALSQATQAVQAARDKLGAPATLTGSFQGTAQAFQQSLASEPILIGAALLAVYVILGVLYESFIHPLTILSTLPSAGLGALLALIAVGQNLNVIGIIAIILLIGIVKKNGIMIVDVALASRARPEPHRRGGGPRGVTPTAATHSDDHRLRGAGRRADDPHEWHWVGVSPAAGLRHCRRSAGIAGTYAVHHASGLHLPRSAACPSSETRGVAPSSAGRIRVANKRACRRARPSRERTIRGLHVDRRFRPWARIGYSERCAELISDTTGRRAGIDRS